MKVLKKYLSVYGLMWKQVTDYRFEFVAELVCTLLPVFALYFLWDSVFSIEGSIKGMSFNEMILYIILARFVAMVITPDFIFEIRGVCKYLPFQYMIYYPAQTLLMDINRDELVLYFFVLTGWIVVFALLLKILWRNGIKHYELIGG